jgi:acetyl esterase/lipase
LKDEGRIYAEKMKAAGNIVLHKEYKQLVHGFYNLPKLSDESIQAHFDVQAFLKKVL